MTKVSNNDTLPPPQRPGFFVRFLQTVLKIFFVIALLLAVAVLGWLGFQELLRSFDVVNGRIDGQYNRLQEQLDEQAAQLDEQAQQWDEQALQLERVQESITSSDEQIHELQLNLSDNIARQDEVLSALTTEINGLLNYTEASTQTIKMMNDSQLLLQQDLIGHGSELDALGGEIDNLKGELTALETSGASLAENVSAFETELSAADPGNLRRAVLIFQVSELISRARLRLVEQNIGLAEADVELAQKALSELMIDAPETLVEPLLSVDRRVLLALDNLPDFPETAVDDLDIAWQELDAILVDLLALDLAPISEPTR